MEADAKREHARTTFDEVADGYEARPPYPPELYERLTDRYGVGQGCDVVEIGPGTGQLTIPLLALGCRVTAVELGANLSRRLAERVAAVDLGAALDIVTSAFEQVELPERSFDLVVSATAFHWIDPVAGIPKAFRLLRPGGWLVLVWNVFGDPDRADPFHEALTAMLGRVEPELAAPIVAGKTGPDGRSWAAEIDGRGMFEAADVEVVHWTGSHSTAELRALFATFSSWISRGPERKEQLLDELTTIADEQFAGQVTRPYQTLVVAARKPGSPVV